MGVQVIFPQHGYETLRRWPRYNVDVPVRVIAHKHTIVQGRGKELNRGGMAVFAGVELSVGEQVAVEFTPPYYGQPIRVRASVRHRNGYTYGIEFMDESETDHKNALRLESVLKTFGSMAN